MREGENEHVIRFLDVNHGIGKTGTKMNIKSNMNTQDMDYEKMGKDMMIDMHISKNGTEDSLDKTCDVYEMDHPQMGKGRILVWKNIPLKTAITVSGMSIQSKVTELDENASIDAAKFAVPTNITFTEVQGR